MKIKKIKKLILSLFGLTVLVSPFFLFLFNNKPIEQIKINNESLDAKLQQYSTSQTIEKTIQSNNSVLNYTYDGAVYDPLKTNSYGDKLYGIFVYPHNFVRNYLPYATQGMPVKYSNNTPFGDSSKWSCGIYYNDSVGKIVLDVQDKYTILDSYTGTYDVNEIGYSYYKTEIDSNVASTKVTNESSFYNNNGALSYNADQKIYDTLGGIACLKIPWWHNDYNSNLWSFYQVAIFNRQRLVNRTLYQHYQSNTFPEISNISTGHNYIKNYDSNSWEYNQVIFAVHDNLFWFTSNESYISDIETNNLSTITIQDFKNKINSDSYSDYVSVKLFNSPKNIISNTNKNSKLKFEFDDNTRTVKITFDSIASFIPDYTNNNSILANTEWINDTPMSKTVLISYDSFKQSGKETTINSELLENDNYYLDASNLINYVDWSSIDSSAIRNIYESWSKKIFINRPTFLIPSEIAIEIVPESSTDSLKTIPADGKLVISSLKLSQWHQDNGSISNTQKEFLTDGKKLVITGLNKATTSFKEGLNIDGTTITFDASDILSYSQTLPSEFYLTDIKQVINSNFLRTNILTNLPSAWNDDNINIYSRTNDDQNGEINLAISISNYVDKSGQLANSGFSFNLKLINLASTISWKQSLKQSDGSYSLALPFNNSYQTLCTISEWDNDIAKSFIRDNYGLLFDLSDANSITVQSLTTEPNTVEKYVKINNCVISYNNKTYTLPTLTINNFIFADLDVSPYPNEEIKNDTNPIYSVKDMYAPQIKHYLETEKNIDNLKILLSKLFSGIDTISTSLYTIRVNEVQAYSSQGILNVSFSIIHKSSNQELDIQHSFTLDNKGVTELKNNFYYDTENDFNTLLSKIQSDFSGYIKSNNIVEAILNTGTNLSYENLISDSLNKIITLDVFASNSWVDENNMSSTKQKLGTLKIYASDSIESSNNVTKFYKNGSFLSSPIFDNIITAKDMETFLLSNKQNPDVINALVVSENLPSDATISIADVVNNNDDSLNVKFIASKIVNNNLTIQTNYEFIFTYYLNPEISKATSVEKTYNLTTNKYAYEYSKSEIESLTNLVKNKVEGSTVNVLIKEVNNRTGSIVADVEVNKYYDSFGNIINSKKVFPDVWFISQKLASPTKVLRNSANIVETSTNIDALISSNNLLDQKDFISNYITIGANPVDSNGNLIDQGVNTSFSVAPGSLKKVETSKYTSIEENLNIYQIEILLQNYFANDSTLSFNSTAQNPGEGKIIYFYAQTEIITTLLPSVDLSGINASGNIQHYVPIDFYEGDPTVPLNELKKWVVENFDLIFENYSAMPSVDEIVSISASPSNILTSVDISITLKSAYTESGIGEKTFNFTINNLTEQQTVTTIKPNIELRNILPIEHLDYNTFSIDVVNETIGKNMRDSIIEDINNNPARYFNDYPEGDIELGVPNRPIVDPNFKPIFTLSSDGTSVEIELNYLCRKKSPNMKADYQRGKVIISNFNSSITTLSGLQVTANSVLSTKLASSISKTDQELINFVCNEVTLKTIFDNYSETFIKTNSTISPSNLEIVEISPVDELGILYVTVNVNDAKVASLGTNGYGKLTNQRFAIKNFTIPVETTTGAVISSNNTNIEGINNLTYSIDVYSNENLKEMIIQSISDKNNLSLWFKNPPSRDRITKPIIDPSTPVTFDYDSTSIRISGKFLSIQENINDELIYKNMSIEINNFNSSITTAVEGLNISNHAISHKFSTDYTKDSPELLAFLRNKTTLESLFKNYPEIFISSNINELSIIEVDADKNLGRMTIKINVKNAKVSTNDAKGYGDKNFIINLSGFQTPVGITSIIPNISISESLNTALIGKYSLDLVNNQELIDYLYNNMILNYELYLINPPTNEQISGRPIFKKDTLNVQLDTNNANVKVTVEYLSTPENPNDPAIYKQGTFILTGFNNNYTVLNSEVSTNGIFVQGISDIMASDLTTSSPKFDVIKQYVSDNFESIFINYPQEFINNKNNLNITLGSANDKNGTRIIILTTSNAYENNEYKDKVFQIKVSGFNNQKEPTMPRNTTTYQVSSLSIKSGATDLLNNLSGMYAKDFVNSFNQNSSYDYQLKTLITLYPSEFFTNINVDDKTNPIIKEGTNLEVVYDENKPLEVTISGYFRQDKNISNSGSVLYEKMSIVISDFSNASTIVDQNAINNLDFSSVLDKSTTPTWQAIELIRGTHSELFKKWITDNISTIVSNFPNSFMEELPSALNNMVLRESGDSIVVTLSNLTITRNGVLVPNQSISFEIGGFSSNDKNTSLEISLVDAVSNIAQFNNIFKNVSTFKIDWDNRIFTSTSVAGNNSFSEVENLLMNYLNSSIGKNLFMNLPDGIDAPVSSVSLSYDNYSNGYIANVSFIGYKNGALSSELSKEIHIVLRDLPLSSQLFLSSSSFQTGFNEYLSTVRIWPSDIDEFANHLKQYVLTWVLSQTANRPGIDIPIIYLDLNLNIDKSKLQINSNGSVTILSDAIYLKPNTLKYPIPSLESPNYHIYQTLTSSGITIQRINEKPVTNVLYSNWIHVIIIGSISVLVFAIIVFAVILILRKRDSFKGVYQDDDISII